MMKHVMFVVAACVAVPSAGAQEQTEEKPVPADCEVPVDTGPNALADSDDDNEVEQVVDNGPPLAEEQELRVEVEEVPLASARVRVQMQTAAEPLYLAFEDSAGKTEIAAPQAAPSTIGGGKVNDLIAARVTPGSKLVFVSKDGNRIYQPFLVRGGTNLQITEGRIQADPLDDHDPLAAITLAAAEDYYFEVLVPATPTIVRAPLRQTTVPGLFLAPPPGSNRTHAICVDGVCTPGVGASTYYDASVLHLAPVVVPAPVVDPAPMVENVSADDDAPPTKTPPAEVDEKSSRR